MKFYALFFCFWVEGEILILNFQISAIISLISAGIKCQNRNFGATVNFIICIRAQDSYTAHVRHNLVIRLEGTVVG